MDKWKRKTADDLSNNAIKGLSKVLSDKKADQYVLTEIYDINKELNFKIIEDLDIKV